MTDERNDAAGRDGRDPGQNPPPLVPPPVRRNDSGEQPYADRGRGAADGPVFVEPNSERADDAAPVFSDRDSAGDGGDDRSPRGTGATDDRPADPAYEERPLDGETDSAGPYAEQTTPAVVDRDRDDDRAAADRRDLGDRDSTTDRDSSTDRDSTDRDTTDHDKTDRNIGTDRTGDRTATDRSPDDRYAPVAARDTSADRQAADRQAVRDTSADAEPVTVAHPSTAPDAAPSPVFVPPAQGGYEQTAAYPPAPAAQREFVEPPVEPRKRGNRGVGSLIAFLSVILFAVIYSAIAAAIIASQQPQDLGDFFIDFVQSPAFYIPAIIFVVSFIIVVLLANRASWWAYVLGSLLVGALVYFGSIGVALLLANPTTLTPDDARTLIEQRAFNPFLITAALVAREVSLWTGSAIASRGRRMRSRNLTAREEYERASAEHRAEYERSYSPA